MYRSLNFLASFNCILSNLSNKTKTEIYYVEYILLRVYKNISITYWFRLNYNNPPLQQDPNLFKIKFIHPLFVHAIYNIVRILQIYFLLIRI